jgi:hypothetical protein
MPPGDLLISTVHRIGARAERKITQELAPVPPRSGPCPATPSLDTSARYAYRTTEQAAIIEHVFER